MPTHVWRISMNYAHRMGRLRPVTAAVAFSALGAVVITTGFVSQSASAQTNPPNYVKGPSIAALVEPAHLATSANNGFTVPPTFFGMQPEFLSPAALSPQQAAGVAKTSGIGSISILSNGGEWATVEPQRGQWDWTYLDQAVFNARSAGVTDVTMVLIGTPRWAASLPPATGAYVEPSPSYASPPKFLADWKEYVRRVASRYKGRINSYEVWSEANLKNRWRGTPAQLASMTKTAYTVVKSIDPKARVVGASSTVRVARWATEWYGPYLAALRATGWPVDALCVHLYSASRGDPLTRQGHIAEIRRVLNSQKASKPLWDCEINYGIPGGGVNQPHLVLDNATGAAYVARTYLDSLRLGIARVYWSAWTPKGSIYGVTMYPGYPAPVAQKVVYGWLAGKSWRGCTVSGPATGRLVSCLVAPSSAATSRPSTIAWSEGANKIFTVPAGATKRCSVAGVCSKVSAGQKITVSRSPIWFGM
jgi:polysaccharide biosynthesis protein PslG